MPSLIEILRLSITSREIGVIERTTDGRTTTKRNVFRRPLWAARRHK